MDSPYFHNAETDLEKQYQKDDGIIHRYLELLANYGEIPGSEDTIILQLEHEFGKKAIDELFSDAPWDYDEPTAEEEEELKEQAKNLPPEEKKLLDTFSEASENAASRLVTALIEWSSICGLDMSGEERLLALRILYVLSKAVSNLLASFDSQRDLDIVKACVQVRHSRSLIQWDVALLEDFSTKPCMQRFPLKHLKESLEDVLVQEGKLIEIYRQKGSEGPSF